MVEISDRMYRKLKKLCELFDKAESGRTTHPDSPFVQSLCRAAVFLGGTLYGIREEVKAMQGREKESASLAFLKEYQSYRADPNSVMFIPSKEVFKAFEEAVGGKS